MTYNVCITLAIKVKTESVVVFPSFSGNFNTKQHRNPMLLNSLASGVHKKVIHKELLAAGLFKYAWSFSVNQALEG